MSNVKKLSIQSMCEFSDDITEKAESMENLEELEIIMHTCGRLPNDITGMRKVKRSILIDSMINSLPASYANLTNLDCIDLKKCSIITEGKDGRLGQKELRDIFGNKVLFNGWSNIINSQVSSGSPLNTGSLMREAYNAR
jgi:hypothetical protein